jgi:hypothetical protein
MEEELFTLQELIQITEEAKKTYYTASNIIHIGTKKLHIIGVSKTNGLILAYGNEWTGQEHIVQRHSLLSRKPYWNQNNKIDNPSKFSLDTYPINYLKIASEIFKSENLKNDINTRPEIFDIYVGKCEHRGFETDYRLITYKGFKIIHTLFINHNKKPFNKKKILDLRQGWTSASNDILSGIHTYNFSYFDSNNTAVFKIILRYLEFEKLEKWYVQINLKDGTPSFTTFLKESVNESKLSVTTRMSDIDFSNFEWLEKTISQIIGGKYQF